MHNTLKRAVIATNQKAQYDAKVKNLLGHKIILAHILTRTVDEFKGMNPREVIPYIEGTPYISKVPIEPGMTNHEQQGQQIIGLNTEREILFINDEALSILNMKRENVIRKSAEELSLKNDLLRRLIRELVTPSDQKEPLKIYADNKESYFKASYIPINNTDAKKDESKKLGDVILLKNITEFKELDSAKTTFISTISHELKTPIAAIMMSLNLLEDKRVGALNDEQEQLSRSIKENSELSLIHI